MSLSNTKTYFTSEFESLVGKIRDLQEKIADSEDQTLFEELDKLSTEYKKAFPNELTQSLFLLMEAGLIEGCLHNGQEDQISFSINAIAPPTLEEADPLMILYGDSVSSIEGNPNKLLDAQQ